VLAQAINGPPRPSPPLIATQRSDAKDFARALYNLLVLRGERVRSPCPNRG
jgi:hypothetical protein